MRDVKEKGEEKTKILLCARSEGVKIKYPRTCPIGICADIICCAFTEFSDNCLMRHITVERMQPDMRYLTIKKGLYTTVARL
jgi:hypothetical protein